MRDSAREAARRGIDYWPFVETPDRPARGLVARLAARAALVVTDDFPCFVVPGQSEALARRAIRYMSSENTARKFRLQPYLDYVASLDGQSSSPSTNQASRKRSRKTR